MKVLLCGEGKHDVGMIERWSIRAESERVLDGWLQPLLRKLLGQDIEFLVVPRNRLVTLPTKNEHSTQKPAGHGKKAMSAKSRAISEKCDVVIYMVDGDTNDPKEWKNKRQQILDGFAALPGEIRAVACVPMSTSESWLLADQGAWDGLGLKKPHTVPPKPETLWGVRSDPEGNHPHCFFKRFCTLVGVADSRETRIDIVEASKIDIIRERCPRSFGTFHADMAA